MPFEKKVKTDAPEVKTPEVKVLEVKEEIKDVVVQKSQPNQTEDLIKMQQDLMKMLIKNNEPPKPDDYDSRVKIIERKLEAIDAARGSGTKIFELKDKRYGNYYKIPSKSKIVEGNFVLPLRNISNGDNPFEVMQDAEVDLKAIWFNGATLIVDENDVCTYRYLMLHKGNVINGGSLFGVKDLAVEAKAELQLLDAEFEATSYVKSLPENERLHTLRYLTLESLESLSRLTPEQIMVRLRDLCRGSHAYKVLALQDDPKVEYVSLYSLAIMHRYLVFEDNEIKFPNGKGKRWPIPDGADPALHFATWVLTDNDGGEIADHLRKKLALK